MSPRDLRSLPADLMITSATSTLVCVCVCENHDGPGQIFAGIIATCVPRVQFSLERKGVQVEVGAKI